MEAKESGDLHSKIMEFTNHLLESIHVATNLTVTYVPRTAEILYDKPQWVLACIFGTAIIVGIWSLVKLLIRIFAPNNVQAIKEFVAPGEGKITFHWFPAMFHNISIPFQFILIHLNFFPLIHSRSSI